MTTTIQGKLPSLSIRLKILDNQIKEAYELNYMGTVNKLLEDRYELQKGKPVKTSG